MSTIMDIFKRISERRGWDVDEDVEEEIALEKARERRVWNEVIKHIHEPFEALSAAIDQGLLHAGYCLEILPRPKAAKKGANVDVEAQGEDIQPGQPGFAAVLDKRVAEFAMQKGELLRIWTRERTLIADEERQDGLPDEYSAERREREQVQLYVVLYMENLMHSSGQAVQDLVAFADRKVADGTMSKKRLIMPTLHRLRKWLVTSLSNSDATAESSPELLNNGANIVFLGDGYGRKKDPEHLPPATGWQRFGTRVRKVVSLLSSEESAFGLRAACATMTIAIIAYLERTQVFYQEQRLVWALIMVAIGMTMSESPSVLFSVSRDTNSPQHPASPSLASSVVSAAPSSPWSFPTSYGTLSPRRKPASSCSSGSSPLSTFTSCSSSHASSRPSLSSSSRRSSSSGTSSKSAPSASNAPSKQASDTTRTSPTPTIPPPPPSHHPH